MRSSITRGTNVHINDNGPVSLVTGGAGFIGSHVAATCLSLGHTVVVLDDLSGGFLDQIPAGALFIKGSVCDEALVRDLFTTHRFTYVYHLAAYAAEGLSHFIRRFNYTNNVIGSMTLINEAVRTSVKRFVFTSSIAVYGKGQLPMTEEMAPRPEDPYGVAKYSVELDLRAAHEMFGLDFIVFRPHNVYGPHQNLGDPYRNVIGIFMNQILQHKPLTVFGDGTQSRAFSFIDDVAPHIANSVNEPGAIGQVINIGADDAYTLNDLVASVSAALGVRPDVRYLPARNEVQHAYADHTKAREIIGAGARVGLSEGLASMAEWARAVGARRGKPFENLEITVNLPQCWAELTPQRG